MDLDSASMEVEKLFDEWYPALVRYGRRFCRERAIVEDCVQQVMLLLFRELSKGSKIMNPKAWALLVLRREVLHSVRREKLHVTLNEDAGISMSADEEAGLPIEFSSLDSFIALLSPREAEVVLLRISGLKYRDIASTLKISTNSVNRLLSRAITKIKACSSLGLTSKVSRVTTSQALSKRVQRLK